MCKSLLVFHQNYVCRTVYEIFSIKEWRDLETGVRGGSRSLKMAPFEIDDMRLSIGRPLQVAVFCTIFKLFDVE